MISAILANHTNILSLSHIYLTVPKPKAPEHKYSYTKVGASFQGLRQFHLNHPIYIHVKLLKDTILSHQIFYL